LGQLSGSLPCGRQVCNSVARMEPMHGFLLNMQSPGTARLANLPLTTPPVCRSPFGAGAPPNFGPYGASNPFAPNFKPPVDTTATAVQTPTPAAPAAPTADNGAPRGEKFAARVASPDGGKAAAGSGAAAGRAEPPKATTNGMPGAGWAGAGSCTGQA
jgi:hypothetical protein